MNNNLSSFHGIYLTLEDLVNVKYEEFYKYLVRKITTSLSNHYQIHPASLTKQYELVKTNLDLKDFLLEMSKARLTPIDQEECIEFEAKEGKKMRYILLADEIDAIPHDITVEFIKTVRSIFIERLSVAGFKAYTMVLCGSADLASLTYGKTSPFNISKVVHLRDFTYEEISSWLTEILQNMGVHPYESFISQLYEKTNGHPYLTQMLCFRIIHHLQKEGRNDILPGDLLEEIDQIIIEGDINLLTTLERINNDEFLKEMTIKVLKGESILYSRTYDIIYQLELAGAISKNGRFCQIRNHIYERFLRQYFDIKDPNTSAAEPVLK